MTSSTFATAAEEQHAVIQEITSVSKDANLTIVSTTNVKTANDIWMILEQVIDHAYTSIVELE